MCATPEDLHWPFVATTSIDEVAGTGKSSSFPASSLCTSPESVAFGLRMRKCDIIGCAGCRCSFSESLHVKSIFFSRVVVVAVPYHSRQNNYRNAW